MTNIVDIVPRARKAVIEISLSLILATPGCTFLPRAREGQCRQLGTSPIKAVPLQPDPRPRLGASFLHSLGRGVTAGGTRPTQWAFKRELQSRSAAPKRGRAAMGDRPAAERAEGRVRA